MFLAGWGELYDGWEKDIPPQYEHRGPSLAEEAGVDRVGKSSSTEGWLVLHMFIHMDDIADIQELMLWNRKLLDLLVHNMFDIIL